VLLNYHIGRFVLDSLCVGDLVRLGLNSVRGIVTDVVIQQYSLSFFKYYNDARSNKRKIHYFEMRRLHQAYINLLPHYC